MSQEILPLFPLHAVLVPGGTLEARIFEPRYLDMVGRCMRRGGGFGVVMIRHGSEVGEVPEVVEVGCEARIVDWGRTPDGLLSLRVEGARRFRVLESDVEADRLLVAQVCWLEEPPVTELSPRHLGLVGILQQLLRERGGEEVAPRFHDASWVSWRLSELLPLSLEQRQALLSMPGPSERLAWLESVLSEMGR